MHSTEAALVSATDNITQDVARIVLATPPAVLGDAVAQYLMQALAQHSKGHTAGEFIQQVLQATPASARSALVACAIPHITGLTDSANVTRSKGESLLGDLVFYAVKASANAALDDKAAIAGAAVKAVIAATGGSPLASMAWSVAANAALAGLGCSRQAPEVARLAVAMLKAAQGSLAGASAANFVSAVSGMALSSVDNKDMAAVKALLRAAAPSQSALIARMDSPIAAEHARDNAAAVAAIAAMNLTGVAALRIQLQGLGAGVRNWQTTLDRPALIF